MTKQAARAFEGFSAEKNGWVRVPNAFFSELLPLIDDLAELKLTVYCFWALQQRDSKYRYIRLRDLREDRIFLASLDADADRAQQALDGALKSAVGRGTLLHMALPAQAGQPEDHLYFMNTEKGRTAVAALDHGDWLPGSKDQPVALIEERPNIFALYEQNIGPLTPILADILRDAENTYPASWVEEAMKVSVENNKRSWRYVEAILRRWATEGKTTPQPADPYDQNPYLQDEYFRRDR